MTASTQESGLADGTGIMGEILTEIREELRNTHSHAPIPIPPSTSVEGNHQQWNSQQTTTTPNQTVGPSGVNTENATGTSTSSSGEPTYPDMEH